MSNAVCSTKSRNKDLYSYALILVCIFSLGLSGCSGLVTANGGNPPPPALTISGVQAAMPTPSGFQVSWSTSAAANSAVDYGKSTSYGSTTPVSSTMVTSHQVAVSGLATGTLYHFRVRSTDAKGNNASSGDMTFATAGDTTPPTVSITSPAANATLTGSVTVTANATDNVAVASVQFKVDNANTGPAITATPYSYSLNTTNLSNGNHVLTAVAADTSGITATSSQVAVNVNNNVATVPSITSLNPTSGPVGTSATIAGTNFGAAQGTSTVAFNGIAAAATAWSAASITATVPSGATTGNVVVTVGGVASNGVVFTVPVPAPSITSLNPTSGLVGTPVTIAGANFGASQGASSVKFNGTTAAPTNWSATSITAPVPNGATTGNVVVTVGGAASNGVSFTVQADTTPPTVPTGLTATAISSSQINLSWTASTDNVGVTGYNVYRGGTKISTSPSTSYQDGGLPASTGFTYTVAAFDAAGNISAPSAGASATTQTSSGGGGIPSALGWYQIPNTKLSAVCPSGSGSACAYVIAAWSGGIADPSRNRLIVWGGGHTDYNGNEVYALDLNTLTMNRITNPSTPINSCVPANADGTPNARHTYNGLAYMANQDRMYVFSGSLACAAGTAGIDTWTFHFTDKTWQRMDPTTGAPPAQLANYEGFGDIADYDPNTGLVFVTDNYQMFTYNYSTNIYTTVGSFRQNDYHLTGVIDPSRKIFITAGNGGAHKMDIAAGHGYPTSTLNMTGCGQMLGASYPGLAYDPAQKLIVGWAGGDTVYLYNPDTDSCTTTTYPNGPGAQQGTGTNGRFRYFPSLGVFAVVNDWQENAYTLRLTPGGGTGGGSGPVISGITVSGITTSSSNISWTTDVPATTQVEYGITTAYGNLTTLNSTLSTSHSQALASLAIGTLFHYRVRSKNSSGVESISGDAIFSTNGTLDTTPPTVSVTTPASGATVSSIVTVSATASDNVGVTSVQFTLDGANLGAAVTTSPYSISWDTTGDANGTHTLSAQARDAAGNVGNATGVSVTVSNSTSTALQDFQTRCAQVGVIVCQGFDNPAIFTAATWPASGLYPGGDGVLRGSLDTTVSASGGGSLKFTIPSMGDGNAAGYWRQLFTSNLSSGPSGAQMFAQNSTFYVQFRQRFSPEFLTNVWPASGGGTTYWKQEIFSNDSSTCGNVELTTVNDFSRGYPMMYSHCGSDVFQVPIAGSDFLNEQGDTLTSGYNCHYQTQNNTSTSCFMYPANTWVTFYYKVSIGNWGQPNSTIQAWVSVGGGPYKEWINITNHTLHEDAVGADYDMVTLLPYMTGRDNAISAGPTAYTWYDELIVSNQQIAAPNN